MHSCASVTDSTTVTLESLVCTKQDEEASAALKGIFKLAAPLAASDCGALAYRCASMSGGARRHASA
ncbi:hypothetical protein VNO78_18224 [Psophocarpus tetragonolobus]|uniref:Uncharacterized protein n=1 Tax=Psophocarpus tetragonolobus TaxID=3891 RepID=A0AAN9SJ28_PSOTE